MQVINTPISPYVQNAPIAYCEDTQKCIFVDPGDEIDKLIQVQQDLSLSPEYIFITHGHIDHAGAAKELATKLKLDIIGPHIDDNFLLQALEIQGQMYGMKAKKIIAGDGLINGSIGRTDLPQGNYQDLIDSIHNHLLVLDDSYIVHCGHGPDTTIGHERKTNPFLNA